MSDSLHVCPGEEAGPESAKIDERCRSSRNCAERESPAGSPYRASRRLPGVTPRAFGFALLAILGIRPTCCFKKCTDDPVEIPPSTVASVEVIPASIQAPTGTPFELRARVRTTSGGVLPTELDLPVEWHGDGVQFSPQKGNPTVAEVNAQAGATAKVWVSLHDHESDPVTIRVVGSGSASGVVTDRVKIWHGSEAAPSAVLIDAASATGWVDDLLIVAAASGALDANLTSGGIPEAAIFAADRAAYLEVGNETAPWTDQADELKRIDQLKPPLTVPMGLWIFVAGDAIREKIEQEVEFTSRIFAANRVGVKLNPTVKAHEQVDAVLPHAWTACELVPEMYGVDPSQGNLEVLYVADMEGDTRGIACPRDGQPGALVIIAWRGHPTTTLTHELAHVFSLGLGYLPCYGHTGSGIHEFGGFDVDNIMWTYLYFTDKSNRRHLSLGQTYRMSLDAASWVNGSVRTGAVKVCQFHPDSIGPCPVLRLDVNPVPETQSHGIGLCSDPTPPTGSARSLGGTNGSIPQSPQ